MKDMVITDYISDKAFLPLVWILLKTCTEK